MNLDYVRGIVSGHKARYVDAEHAVDLDLVYVTDRIIIMGWPATGWAAAYRNKRRDVLKFIEQRHGDQWWVWNLCPLYENAYSAESMRNRVSRYPFPDHHPPPLALLPLAVKEMTSWLNGGDSRVAIIHCKAGKGRSGTLLCSYLLSLPQLPGPPSLQLSYSLKDRKASDSWLVIGHGDEVDRLRVEADTDVELSGQRSPLHIPMSTSTSLTTLSADSVLSQPITCYDAIAIGDEDPLDSSGQYDRRDGKVDAVFKLHSSRRMKPSSKGRGVSIPSQRRWCRYVNLLFSKREPASYGSNLKISVESITILLHPPTGWQKPLARLVVGDAAGQGRAWVSIARYDDAYVEQLGKRRDVTWGGVAGEGTYDRQKMFRTCGRLTAQPSPPDDKYVAHLTRPASPIILQRGREFRMKFHLASIPLGWAWMIPAFHLPEPTEPRRHTLVFPKTQIDFAIGPGAAIQEIRVELKELAEDERVAPLLSEDEERRAGLEDEAGESPREEGD